jgi:hypothetical protein
MELAVRHKNDLASVGEIRQHLSPRIRELAERQEE